MEATSYRVFGVSFPEEDFDAFRQTYAEAYDNLAGEDPRWREEEFCRTKLVSLFRSMVDYMGELGLEGLGNSQRLRANFAADEDNAAFMRALARLDWRWLFDRLSHVEITRGESFLISYQDGTGSPKRVHVDWSRLVRALREPFLAGLSYTDRISNELSKFVQWVKTGTRPILSCIVLGGVSTIAVLANLFATNGGNPLSALLTLIITVICLVATLFSGAKDISAGLQRVGQSVGITMS